MPKTSASGVPCKELSGPTLCPCVDEHKTRFVEICALFGAEPKFDRHCVYGETDPECNLEELVWLKIRQGWWRKTRP